MTAQVLKGQDSILDLYRRLGEETNHTLQVRSNCATYSSTAEATQSPCTASQPNARASGSTRTRPSYFRAAAGS